MDSTVQPNTNGVQSVPCPRCHVVIRSSDYFCYNCGKEVHPKPPDTSVSTQLLLYLGSIMLPPLGVIWGFKYLRQKDQKSIVIGIICFALTFIVLIVAVLSTIQLLNTVNDQVNQQMQHVIGF